MDDSQRKLGAEFVGTFALIFFGVGSALQGADLVGQALANGLAIGIMVTAVGHISGGHFNPAVTLSMLVTGRISPAESAPLLGQPAGGRHGGGARAARDLPVGRDRRRQSRRPGGRRPRHQHGQCARGRDRGHVLPRLRHLRRRRRQARCLRHPRRPADRPHHLDRRAGPGFGLRCRVQPRSLVRPGARRRQRSTTSGSGSSARPSARSSQASPTTGYCSGAHQGSTFRTLVPLH